jgi:hypothetical protein
MEDLIVINPKNAKADVYFDFVNAKSRHVYLVKVSFPDAGIHINSITVQPNPKALDKLWVQSPRYFYKGQWIWPIQMVRNKAIWPLIEKLALEAVAKSPQHTPIRSTDSAFETGFVKAEHEFM